MGAPDYGHEDAKANSPAASLFKYYAHRIEDDMIQPIITYYCVLFEKRPILALFTAIFTCLSVLPVVSFLGASLSVVAVLASIALSCALIAASGIILGFLCILAFILVATFFTSIFLTLSCIATYLLFRLAILTKKNGRSGVYRWTEETKQRIIALSSTTPAESYAHKSDITSGTRKADLWENEVHTDLVEHSIVKQEDQ